MILDPVADVACLALLVREARELAAGSAAARIAAQLGSVSRVVSWLQSLPQSDDDGRERLQAIQCDVPQRLRLFPADPNCFERTLAALALCEVLDPLTPRCAITIERPVRHTSLVELRGNEWTPVDLFPRRNFSDVWRGASASEIGKDILQGFHRYVGKPLLSAYGLGGVADQLGDVEDRAIGRSKPAEPAAPSSPAPSSPSSPARPSPSRTKQGENPDVTTAPEEDRSETARVGFWPTDDRARRSRAEE